MAWLGAALLAGVFLAVEVAAFFGAVLLVVELEVFFAVELDARFVVDPDVLFPVEAFEPDDLFAVEPVALLPEAAALLGGAFLAAVFFAVTECEDAVWLPCELFELLVRVDAVELFLVPPCLVALGVLFVPSLPSFWPPPVNLLTVAQARFSDS
ncbi:MAG: hypothetical protein H0V82_01330 [Candidatus Protochlamydia sp.]|nr:hypothetical protein [Candidatus Protochlamydia sp.]